MSEWIELEPGLIVNPETGELLAENEDDRLGKLGTVILNHHFAVEQEKEWISYRRALAAVIIKEFGADRQRLVDDLRVSVRSSRRTNQNVEAIRHELEEAELTLGDWRLLALVAKGWDTAPLSGSWLQDLIEKHTIIKESAPWVDSQRIRRPAPKMTPATITDEDEV